MDDGGVSRNINGGRITSVECRLFTYCSEEEADTIIAYFQEVWGLNWKKRRYRKGDQFILVCNTVESRKFEDIIGKFIIPSMKYKLPSFYSTRVPDTLRGEEMVCSA
jgi:hypothetical protein